MASTILDPVKTPLPEIEQLNFNKETSAGCMLAEVIPFGCTCGIDFTIRGYDIANDFIAGILSFDQIATKYKLNGCCRMRLLSPFTTNIVSMDINAKVNETHDDAIVEHVPYPDSIFNPSSFLPPSL